MLFDSHCHLDDEKFGPDREEAFARMRENGVGYCMCVGSDIATSLSSIAFAKAHENVYAAVGVHPHEAEKVPSGYIDTLRNLLQEDRVQAIGEIGLDYYYDSAFKDAQKRVMMEQLVLAKETDKPVIFHIRDAHGDMLDIFRANKTLIPRGIIHCFSGSAETAKEYLQMGFYISFAGPVTFKKAPKLWEAAKIVPTDKILCETDSPYMSPEPVRGRRNEPANVRYVNAKLAALHEITEQEMTEHTFLNALRIYGIPRA